MRSKTEIEDRILALESNIQVREKDIKTNSRFNRIVGRTSIEEYILALEQEICVLKWTVGREEENYDKTL
jgi:hypothetical protein